MREFLHVDDLSNACVFALENWCALFDDAPKDAEGKPLAFLNVGSGVDLSIKELAKQIAAVVGFEGTIKWDSSKPDGTPKKQLELSRIKELGWSCRIPLNEGLVSTYSHFCTQLNSKGPLTFLRN